MPLSDGTRVWLGGLISATASGLGSGLALFAVAHETPVATLVKASVICAIIAVVNFLKQSPLPKS